MTILGREIAAFERMREELTTSHFGQWVVFHDGVFVGAFDEFELAAETALERFDRGPYLIRQVGAPDTIQLGGGMTFTHAHALDARRV